MIARDLCRQQALDTNTKAIQQTTLTKYRRESNNVFYHWRSNINYFENYFEQKQPQKYHKFKIYKM